MDTSAKEKQHLPEIKLPRRECDIVMKGGVTSGIVYPPALLELKDTYIFNSIGGTSAGAVAAAAAAAAEYGRQSGGFDRFHSATAEFNDNLIGRFGTPKSTRPLFEMLKAVGSFGAPDGSKLTIARLLWRAVASLMRFDTWAFAFGAILGVLLGVGLGLGLPTLFAWAVGPLALDPNSEQVQWTTRIAVGLLTLGALWLLRNVLSNLLKIVLGGLVGGAAVLGLFWLVGNSLNNWYVALTVLSAVIIGLIGGVVGGVIHLLKHVLFTEVPKNFYGIVNGHDPDPKADPNKPRLLIDFVAKQLDEIAGLQEECRPLTFGHLCQRKLKDKHNNVDGKKVQTDNGITLQFITTNISQGIPYRLPFKDHLFLFSECDMKSLFPRNVVDYMVLNSYKSHRIPKHLLPKGFHFLPDADHFPVVVAMRMSLAIPLFFSAIPLYTIKPTSYGKTRKPQKDSTGAPLGLTEDDFQRHLFSDGGTTSNFPIHSFDRWLPTRPTFGINLAAMPPKDPKKKRDNPLSLDFLSTIGGVVGGGQNANEPSLLGDLVNTSGADLNDIGNLSNVDNPNELEADDEKPGIDLPEVELGLPNQVPATEWQPIEDPFSFIMKVVDTARENRDTLQAALPGYRERIVKVRLSSAEGGMNLMTSQGNIDNMTHKGREAGNILASNFNFKHHQWTRFLALMSDLETELQKFSGALERGKYYELLLDDVDRQTDDISEDFPYRTGHNKPEWRQKAYNCAQALNDVLQRWEQIAAVSTNVTNLSHKITPREAIAMPAQAQAEETQATQEVRTPADQGANVQTGGVGVDVATQPDDCLDPNGRSVLKQDCDCAAIGINFWFFNRKPPSTSYNPQPKSVLRMNPEL